MSESYSVDPTDAELCQWLEYIECPDKWLCLPTWRRWLAGEMSKGRNRTYKLALIIALAYLVVRSALLVIGVPITPIDLAVFLAIGVGIGILLMTG